MNAAVTTQAEQFADRTAALSDLRDTQARRRAFLLESRTRVLTRTREELAALRRLSSPAEILTSAPAAACRACGFDRALVSTVRGSVWSPVAMHAETGAANPVNMVLTDLVRGREIPLSSAMPEAELVRRRAPVLVSRAQSDPRLFRPLVEVSGSREYVAAPIQASGAVIGFLHADCRESRRALTPADRDRVQSFADGLGLVLERAVTLERLGLQQEQMGRAATAVRAVGESPLDRPARLIVDSARTAHRPQAGLSDPPPDPADGLTPREREVMQLLLSGATNAEIANRLTVSETTVKSHVRQILRKLKATNRAEAIARYLQLARRQGSA